MAFQDELKLAVERAVRIAKLDTSAMIEVADDEQSLVPGITIVAISGLAMGLGSTLLGNLTGVVTQPFFAVIGAFIGVGIWYLIGMLFKPAEWDFMRLFRVLAHAHLIGWAGIVVFVVPFAILYQLIVSVLVVETIGKVSRGKAAVIVLAPAAVCCVLAGVGFSAALLSLAGLAHSANS